MLYFLMYRLYCKDEPINVKYGIGKEGGIEGNRGDIPILGIDKHDTEGRVITAEFEKFYFITAYVPNAGDKLKRYSVMS